MFEKGRQGGKHGVHELEHLMGKVERIQMSIGIADTYVGQPLAIRAAPPPTLPKKFHTAAVPSGTKPSAPLGIVLKLFHAALS